ncbi:FtsW/RodA/SpoVE family cell cycle protein [Lactovum miscens]|uniref:Probable peptidoglycan glycosyltransferase FtsW n=1 Tax=Lactovum miscens TaxID=190387 RepID=A0A841C5M8_9LACT|nr:FtsW/RodA/SpoVE family cell cycle protein [Lactovum miscens]MBB5888113.1 cell division protein FtsW [Lactovum miscens]
MNQPEKISKSNFLDYSILLPFLLLAIFGLVVVFSVTVPEQVALGANIYKQVISQSVFLILSLVVMSLIYRINIRTFQLNTLLGVFVIIEGILLLAARFIFKPVNGAHGWIPLPGGLGTIQPAEFLKIFIVWYMALILTKRQENIAKKDLAELFPKKHLLANLFSGWRRWIVFLIAAVIIMPDFGNGIICIIIAMILLGVSGISSKWANGIFRIFVIIFTAFFGLVAITKGNIVPSSLSSFTYFNNRFMAWIDPFSGLNSYGKQLANSYFAISNGGWTGLGLGNSIEKKGYLPFASTDFVFPIVIEEIGVIGGFIVLGILFFLILRIMLVGIRARHPFNAFICIGVSSMLLVQTFVNVGGATGLIPETGVTFPFLSQGGSSLFVLSIGIALALNASAHEKLLELSVENNLIMKQRENTLHWK